MRQTRAEMLEEIEMWKGRALFSKKVMVAQTCEAIEKDAALIKAQRKSPTARIVAALEELHAEGIRTVSIVVGGISYTARVAMPDRSASLPFEDRP